MDLIGWTFKRVVVFLGNLGTQKNYFTLLKINKNKNKIIKNFCSEYSGLENFLPVVPFISSLLT